MPVDEAAASGGEGCCYCWSSRKNRTRRAAPTPKKKAKVPVVPVDGGNDEHDAGAHRLVRHRKATAHTKQRNEDRGISPCLPASAGQTPSPCFPVALPAHCWAPSSPCACFLALRAETSVSGHEAGAQASAEVLCGKKGGGVSRLHLCGFIVNALDSKRRSKPHVPSRQLHALHHTHELRRIAGGHIRLAVHQPGDMLCSQRFSNKRGGEGGRV